MSDISTKDFERAIRKERGRDKKRGEVGAEHLKEWDENITLSYYTKEELAAREEIRADALEAGEFANADDEIAANLARNLKAEAEEKEKKLWDAAVARREAHTKTVQVFVQSPPGRRVANVPSSVDECEENSSKPSPSESQGTGTGRGRPPSRTPLLKMPSGDEQSASSPPKKKGPPPIKRKTKGGPPPRKPGKNRPPPPLDPPSSKPPPPSKPSTKTPKHTPPQPRDSPEADRKKPSRRRPPPRKPAIAKKVKFRRPKPSENPGIKLTLSPASRARGKSILEAGFEKALNPDSDLEENWSDNDFDTMGGQ